jgi:hypothetical protein
MQMDEIGSGSIVSGSLIAINWAATSYFIKTETDPSGGTDYNISGTSQILAVPYAMYAEKAGNGFSGNYSDLIDKPLLFNGTWLSLSGKPTFATVATSGSFSDLSNKPTTIAGYGITNAFDGLYASLAGKPTLSTIATTGSYNDLKDKPTGNNSGDMQYWNGSAWVMVPVGQPGQYLQLTTSSIPSWSGASFPTLTTSIVSSIKSTSAL